MLWRGYLVERGGREGGVRGIAVEDFSWREEGDGKHSGAALFHDVEETRKIYWTLSNNMNNMKLQLLSSPCSRAVSSGVASLASALYDRSGFSLTGEPSLYNCAPSSLRKLLLESLFAGGDIAEDNKKRMWLAQLLLCGFEVEEEDMQQIASLFMKKFGVEDWQRFLRYGLADPSENKTTKNGGGLENNLVELGFTKDQLLAKTLPSFGETGRGKVVARSMKLIAMSNGTSSRFSLHILSKSSFEIIPPLQPPIPENIAVLRSSRLLAMLRLSCSSYLYLHNISSFLEFRTCPQRFFLPPSQRTCPHSDSRKYPSHSPLPPWIAFPKDPSGAI